MENVLQFYIYKTYRFKKWVISFFSDGNEFFVTIKEGNFHQMAKTRIKNYDIDLKMSEQIENFF